MLEVMVGMEGQLAVLEDLRDRCAAHCRDHGQSVPSEDGTAAFLSRAAKLQLMADGSTDEEVERGLMALIRKVEIARQVWTAYEPNWGRPLERVELAPNAWPLLISTFLLEAVRMADRRRKCQALKLVNAAATAIDIYVQKSGAEFVAEFERCIDEFLRLVVDD
jgi:hypothetical protein